MIFDLNGYIKALTSQNAEKLEGFFLSSAIIRWHNTNERFTVGEFVRVNCDYPGEWTGVIERVEDFGGIVVTVTKISAADGSYSCHATSFFKIKNDKISELDEYWGDDAPPPDWRVKMRVGKSIK